jgi:hypothetical protein
LNLKWWLEFHHFQSLYIEQFPAVFLSSIQATFYPARRFPVVALTLIQLENVLLFYSGTEERPYFLDPSSVKFCGSATNRDLEIGAGPSEHNSRSSHWPDTGEKVDTRRRLSSHRSH